MDENMKSENQTPNSEPSTAGSTSSEQTTQNLVKELNRLGSKFAEVVQVAWESDQRKKIEHDLKTGISSLATTLEEGLKKVSESPQTKEFFGKAEDVAETVADRVQKSQFAQDVADGIVKGLRTLTEQVDKLASELQSQKQQTPPTSSSGTPPAADQAQDIPINKV